MTPGVGLAWHAARREWRELAVVGAVVAGMALIGVVIDPRLWADYLASLTSAPDNYPGIGHETPQVLARMVIGAGVAAYAGWSDRKWLLPVALLVAMPGFFPYSFAVLTASIVLWQDSRKRQPERTVEPMAVPVLWAEPVPAPMALSDDSPVPVVEEVGRGANSRISIRK